MAIAGSSAQFTSPNDPLFTLEDGKQMNREEFIEDIMHATNTCINICQTHGAVNEHGSNAEPFFMREFRRRLYAAIYYGDKTLAVFYGRPPMMGWRYSDRKMLLDISDRAMASDDTEVLNAELSKLDSDGWNTECHLHPTTFGRMRCQLAVFKERLLEQSLAGEKDSEVVRNVEYV
ncbi:uncharacterized protein J4E92_002597 [Alternaria infectoria]|uniref:uncharacterized protein n=1 Tax=Alternaria infectoria TaxID=45303 RepID=UPI002220B1B8|nr:uncharacterized protein J4E92_002597 [Alternaria infectoria]KAI4935309.1 hypothetical protein J4E92_002597 [Alternaria infectoria]